jgi:hypothetical protein
MRKVLHKCHDQNLSNPPTFCKGELVGRDDHFPLRMTPKFAMIIRVVN